MRFDVVLRLGALQLVVLLAACSKPGAGPRDDAVARDSSMNRGDSLVSALTGPPSYIDSLRDAIDRESLATGMVANANLSVDSAPRASVATFRTARTKARPDNAGAEALRLRNVRAANAALVSVPPMADDTARGIVKIVGAAPSTLVVLMSLPGHAAIALSGLGIDDLRPLAGLDVMVHGIKASERDVVVNGFVVRMADGNPAWDGRLEMSGAAYQLRLTDGSGLKHIAQLPNALRDATGARVWIATKSGSSSPQAFGIIGRR